MLAAGCTDEDPVGLLASSYDGSREMDSCIAFFLPSRRSRIDSFFAGSVANPNERKLVLVTDEKYIHYNRFFV